MPVSSKPIYFHTSDFNGADIDIIFESGGRFRLDAPSNNGPYAAKESQYGMIYFEHTYIYSQDGKSLDEISDFRSRISRFDASIVIAGRQAVFLCDKASEGQYLRFAAVL